MGGDCKIKKSGFIIFNKRWAKKPSGSSLMWHWTFLKFNKWTNEINPFALNFPKSKQSINLTTKYYVLYYGSEMVSFFSLLFVCKRSVKECGNWWDAIIGYTDVLDVCRHLESSMLWSFIRLHFGVYLFQNWWKAIDLIKYIWNNIIDTAINAKKKLHFIWMKVPWCIRI